MSGTKGKSRQSIANPLELGREAVHTVKQETIKEAQETGKTFLSQLLGIDLKKADNTAGAEKHQDQAPTHANGGEIFNFANHKSSEKTNAQTEKAPKHQEAAINYHYDVAKNREKASKSELHGMQQNVEQIKVELSKLISSSQVLKMEFASVAVEQSTESVGQYHLNFFEWMLTVIRAARQKVEESQSWVGAMKGKGAKKSYWGMFKKHGTTFGLSGERSVATQVG